MSPEFIDELVERIVQRVTEKSKHDLEFYTINEVASLLKVSRATVERRIKDEELKTYKFGGNIRIRKRDLMSFLDSASLFEIVSTLSIFFMESYLLVPRST